MINQQYKVKQKLSLLIIKLLERLNKCLLLLEVINWFFYYFQLKEGEYIMGFIWTLIVGGVIGAIAGAITNKGGSMGWIANIVAGLVGSSIGQAIFGSWGPSFAGMALFPSILGAVIVVAVVSFFVGRKV